MKICLITPKNPPSFWTYDRVLPTLGKRCVFPNLSMPTLAGLTPREHEVVLCDENVGRLDFDVAADVFGVTGYIVHGPRMREILAELRRRGRFVVVGGPYASLCPEQLRGACDVLFVGEAEETWPRFLRDFAAGRWDAEYRASELPDLSLSPPPRFDLLDVSKYFALTIQFGRGCPFQCEFCDITVLYGHRPRTKRAEQVLREIEECRSLGAQQIFVVDDNFIGNRKLAKELLRQIAAWGAERGHPVDFNTEVSLNVAEDDELLALLRAARFTTVFVGIESPRTASLAETRKSQNLRGDLIASVRKIQSYGIQVQAGMIVGFDHDDAGIFAEQLRFLEQARIPVSMTGMLQALPRTPLHERVLREGRLVAESTGDQFVLSNIAPKSMSREALYRGYRGLLRQLYSFGNYRRRALDFLLHKGERKGGELRVRSGELRLFARILRETVLRGGPRRAWFTLSLLGATLLRRPAMLKDAVTLALVHQALHGYVSALGRRLDEAIARLEGAAPAPSTPALGSN
jgi:radical SAM superfamily enzyme YgiQ (UPF0313 family)